MKARFLFWLAACLPVAAQVKLTQGTDRIMVVVDGKPFTDFFIGADAPKPYLHPLRSASGKIVTRRFPMETVEGEVKDHPHHRGLWFTHGDVNKIDFWANEANQKGRMSKGKIITRKILELKSGKKDGRVKASFDWLGPDDAALLNETRGMVFYSDPVLRIIDLDILLTARQKVVFGDTKEGTFAIRMATSMDEKHGGKMTAAGGKVGEKEIWGKQSPWVDYVGPVEGETLGVAIFDHPTSTRYPTYWHARAYGLFAANIFGLHDFIDKTKDGSLTLEPGQSARFRYRVIIHPGDTASAGIAELYKKYAALKLK